MSKHFQRYLTFNLIVLFVLAAQDSHSITLASRYLLQDGVNGVDGLDYPVAVTISPDSRHLYVAGAEEDALSVFTRDINSGALTFVEVQKDGIGGVDGMDYPETISLSPDGKYVYVAGVNDGSVTIFRRDNDSGKLTYVDAQTNGLGDVREMVISPDGRHIYVTGSGTDTLSVYSRDSESGLMSFIEIHEEGVDNVYGLNGIFSICISPDGKHLYTTGWWDDAVAVFVRDIHSGTLIFVNAYFDNINGIDGLDAPSDITVSPDGRHVYVTGISDNAIAVFSRNTESGALTFVEVKKDRVEDVTGLDGAIAVSVSPEGDYVYAAGTSADSVVVFSRDTTTGSLSFIEAQEGLIGGVEGLTGTHSATLSPDGNYVYVVRPDANALSVLVKNYSQADWIAEQEKWDVGLDGKVDLKEAIRALQIATGAR